MIIEPFAQIYQRAVANKGSEQVLTDKLCSLKTPEQLRAIPSDRWLAEFTRKVFQCGMVWRVINNKWAGFEEVFWQFDVEKLLMMPDELWEEKARDPRIVRCLYKVMTIKANAQMIFEEDLKCGFSQLIANWDCSNITALWHYLKKHGSRLGGNTGPYALRAMGKDTFFLTHDIEAYLRAHNLIDGGLHSKRNLSKAQNAFLEWQQQSQRPLSHISQIVAWSVG
ncbi:DNA-3-methyladenine glycosylase I [Pasteurellaceae bacterium HPA106]|uniref:DNA-3-methyladenine glycosylase I n=1 Tax=Spirabiliibacterium pneumoniae TaxID=221400 RepID=UPI001AACF17D|nr:DNA-3-methyladenine glycosylase I [Spirabiliibacterium pneumoniae]MBE2896827.1 DNA-3-methyladenine glycosylase I [Spirabiliibacterium pneumoniae]